jgi:hypothetical protein
MSLRRTVLFLATLLVVPLAVMASTSSAQALGQQTQTWSTGYFKASITVNWTSKHNFTMSGWIEDTKCDGRGVYLDDIYQEHPKAGGGYALGSAWYIGAKDINGCNNGKVTVTKSGYTAGKQNVPLLQVPIYSEDKTAVDNRLTYPKVWNNPYIDG